MHSMPTERLPGASPPAQRSGLLGSFPLITQTPGHWRLAGRARAGSRGEYISSSAKLTICVGLGGLAGMRDSVAGAISVASSPLPIRAICGKYLEPFRSDPEIRRLHFELFGW